MAASLIGAVVLAAALRPRGAGSADQRLDSARASFSKGDVASAIRDLEGLERSGSADARALALLGRAYESTGRLDDALEQYRASLESDPNQAELRHRVAMILKSRGDTDEAMSELEEAVATDGGLVGSRLALADLYAQAGRIRDATEQYDAVLELRPQGVDLAEIRSTRDGLR